MNFFSLSQKVTWQNEVLLELVVNFLSALSQICLWDVCGGPCWPGTHWKMHNWRWTFNIFYLGNERNSGQLFIFIFFSRVILSSFLSGSEKKTLFFFHHNNYKLLTYHCCSWVWEECLLCVTIVRIQPSDQLEHRRFKGFVYQQWVAVESRLNDDDQRSKHFTASYLIVASCIFNSPSVLLLQPQPFVGDALSTPPPSHI